MIRLSRISNFLKNNNFLYKEIRVEVNSILNLQIDYEKADYFNFISYSKYCKQITKRPTL
ncbi:hypothetical protein KL86DYS2_12432 [uncultured Dysgonomonas sp.]|uniref:Uncharacterized protein n=1 Tax=uncultured Dysgonomonas sp. TaxID=206096 RepID=A0A212JVD5_9BACT|nr:hypothetical protein KL86DYS2_12432 [uncultured Dysgonomonas sp.]